MSVWHSRIYKDQVTGEVVAQYMRPDGVSWVSSMTTEEMDAREEARRSIRDKTNTEVDENEGKGTE